MKSLLYIVVLLLGVVLPAQSQTQVYRGQVSVKQNGVECTDHTLSLDMDISLCGLSVGRYQSLMLIPMLRNGRDSLLLQPIVVNGINKQKMYKRAVAFKGRQAADAGAYTIVKNDPAFIQVISYKKAITFRPWMKHAQLILVGELDTYEGTPVQTLLNVLTNDLGL